MMFKFSCTALGAMAVAVLLAAPAPAQMLEDEAGPELHFQHGQIDLEDGLAQLQLSPEFGYLDAEQTEQVIVAWGNPPGIKTLGMIAPSDLNPLSPEGWGVLIQYEEDGYVSDKDAETIDFDKLLVQMKEDNQAANKERRKAGYTGLELVGWAEPPHYDPESHKLYWAKNLHADDAEGNSLNYNIRVLGRRGVLVLNAVAPMEMLPMVREDMQAVLGQVEFNPGHRYSDFVPGTDKVAAYGLAALVGGTLAAKAGFFKVLLAGLLAAKKLVLVGVAAIGAFLSKLFGGRRKQGQDAAA